MFQGWVIATIIHLIPIKQKLTPPKTEFPETVFVMRTHQSRWSSHHPQPGWGQSLPTVSHGTAGRLRGLGGICAFPSVAHSLPSKPLPLSAAICFQPYPTGRKHERFHHRIWMMHSLGKKQYKAYGMYKWLGCKTKKEEIYFRGKMLNSVLFVAKAVKWSDMWTKTTVNWTVELIYGSAL